eukprot:13499324-Ditylum_brightwellii.AAC.1
MANDIKDIESKEINSTSEKSDDITIAECYIDEEEGSVPLYIYLSTSSSYKKSNKRTTSSWKFSRS